MPHRCRSYRGRGLSAQRYVGRGLSAPLVSALIGLTLAGGTGRAQTSPSPEARLKAAQYKQDIERDCKGALSEYQQIVNDYERSTKPPEREVAARALVQSASCYRKLGDEQARPVYERVIKEFKEQTQSVAQARNGLDALSGTTVTSRPTRLLTLASSMERSGLRLLADGRLAGTDSNTGNLVAIDPGTGRVTRIVASNTAGPDPDKITRAAAPVLSSDLKTVAYMWVNEGKAGGQFLRVARTDGSTSPRTLVGSPEGAFSPTPLSWARDGSAVLASIERHPSGNAADRFYELAWVPLNGTGIRVVKRLESWQLEGDGPDAALSPDGRFIAYAARKQRPGSTDTIFHRSIVVIPAGGGAGTEIFGVDNNVEPTWTADGLRLIYVRQGTNYSDIWSVAMGNGKRVGAPERLRREYGQVTLRGITRSGRLHYSLQRDSFSTMVIAVTDGGARIDGAAMEVTDQFQGVAPSWSPDGQLIAFKRPLDGGPFKLVVRSSGSGAEMTYSSGKIPMGGSIPLWRAARTIQPIVNEPILVTVGSKGMSASKDTQPLSPNGSRSFDGRTAVAVLPDATIVRTNLASGTTTTARIPPGRRGAWAASPDGRLVATMQRDPNGRDMALTIVTIDTGEARTRLLPTRSQQMLTWTLDSRRVLISEGSPLQWRIVVVDPASSEEPKPTGIVFAAQGLSGMSLNPNGTRLAVTMQDRNTEAWMLSTPWSIK